MWLDAAGIIATVVMGLAGMWAARHYADRRP